MSKLETWLKKRDISLHLKTIDPETLNKVLRKIYGEVETGTLYFVNHLTTKRNTSLILYVLATFELDTI